LRQHVRIIAVRAAGEDGEDAGSKQRVHTFIHFIFLLFILDSILDWPASKVKPGVV
jgi:hypothetical protein